MHGPLSALLAVLAFMHIACAGSSFAHESVAAKRQEQASDTVNGLSFSVPPSNPVVMTVSNSARYQLNGSQAEEEYTRMLPSGGHLVYISTPPDRPSDMHDTPSPKPYTVTLFHQLKCLDIIRRDLTDDSLEAPTQLCAHCMNYLRQIILCRLNTKLETITTASGTSGFVTYETTCADWEVVYEEAERNQRVFAAWVKSAGTG